ncbi:MAG: NAD(P)H-hydrate dehydratase [Dehalococcoidales bacterium]|nr:NAD(P)H-hydrate dehydratase [Dehalococcoidales bacterium]
MKIVTAEEMRRIEQECGKTGLPTTVLMENAGKAVAEEVRQNLKYIVKQHILFLIGPGNNGGDGLVAARHLHDWGAEVSLWLAAPRQNDSNLEQVKQRGIHCIEAAQDANLAEFEKVLATAHCVVDALFGTGKIRPVDGVIKQALEKVNDARHREEGLRVIAIDLPSGLDADTGAIDPAAPYADDTVTLGFPKPGLFLFPGAERVGRLTIADIGIPASLAQDINTELLTRNRVRSALPPRPLGANKGSFGKVLAVAGSNNYIGAAYLACSGAMRAGAGLVTLAVAKSLQAVLAAKLTEAIYLPLPEKEAGIIDAEAAETVGEELKQYDVLLLGCGLGQGMDVSRFVKSLLRRKSLPPMIIDADGLNILAQISRWWQNLPDETIITPHPGEMARLSGKSVEEIQSDRFGTALKAAQDWRNVVVLKGAYTVIAAPDGQLRVSPFANPGLASAGTGDVLCGAIAGLRAQGLSAFDAAALGVYLHGLAGEIVRQNFGDAGMLASDLLPALPAAIKQVKSATRQKGAICY